MAARGDVTQWWTPIWRITVVTPFSGECLSSTSLWRRYSVVNTCPAHHCGDVTQSWTPVQRIIMVTSLSVEYLSSTPLWWRHSVANTCPVHHYGAFIKKICVCILCGTPSCFLAQCYIWLVLHVIDKAAIHNYKTTLKSCKFKLDENIEND